MSWNGAGEEGRGPAGVGGSRQREGDQNVSVTSFVLITCSNIRVSMVAKLVLAIRQFAIVYRTHCISFKLCWSGHSLGSTVVKPYGQAGRTGRAA